MLRQRDVFASTKYVPRDALARFIATYIKIIIRRMSVKRSHRVSLSRDFRSTSISLKILVEQKNTKALMKDLKLFYKRQYEFFIATSANTIDAVTPEIKRYIPQNVTVL